jgi:hypothetical protein
MNVFERRNYPVISLLKYLSYYITKLSTRTELRGTQDIVTSLAYRRRPYWDSSSITCQHDCGASRVFQGKGNGTIWSDWIAAVDRMTAVLTATARKYMYSASRSAGVVESWMRATKQTKRNIRSRHQATTAGEYNRLRFSLCWNDLLSVQISSSFRIVVVTIYRHSVKPNTNPNLASSLWSLPIYKT